MEDAKRVTVLDYPGFADYHMDAAHQLHAHLTFARTCHSTEPVDGCDGDHWAMLGDVASGKTLWQVAETLYYTLRLEGMSRVLSHQLVRARVGWTFSETCTGDHDWRHGDFLVPRPWMQPICDNLPKGLVHASYIPIDARIDHMLESKALYAACVDGGESPNTARYMLHPNLKVFVHARVNLMALAVWYAKRSCTMTQSWEMVTLAERVKEAVIDSTPWAAPAFKCPCDAGKCWYMGAKETPLAMANYYVPDEKHDTFDWNPASFLYGKTPYEMNSGPVAFTTREYHGHDQVA